MVKLVRNYDTLTSIINELNVTHFFSFKKRAKKLARRKLLVRLGFKKVHYF